MGRDESEQIEGVGPRSGLARIASIEGRALASITAIHVDAPGSGTASFGLVVTWGNGRTFRAACRQSIPDHRCDVHLGAVVPVVIDADRAVRIEWAHQDVAWRPLSGRLEDGVHDVDARSARLRLERGRRALATVLGQSAAGPRGCDGEVDVEIEVGTTGTTHLARLARREAPFYARHLLRAGAILPAAVGRADATVTVDWLAASNGLVTRHRPPPATVLAALASGGLGATSADAPGLRRPVLRRPAGG
jgi:hypothetical protein